MNSASYQGDPAPSNILEPLGHYVNHLNQRLLRHLIMQLINSCGALPSLEFAAMRLLLMITELGSKVL